MPEDLVVVGEFFGPIHWRRAHPPAFEEVQP